MPEKVQASDHFSRIAARNGFVNWETLWAANSGLQAKRRNPNILFHGVLDPANPPNYLHEPDEYEATVSSASHSGATSSHHPFTTATGKLFLRFRVLDDQFAQFPGATYELTVDGRAIDPGLLAPDGDGVISVEVPPTAEKALLKLKYTPPAPSSSTGSTPSVGPSAPVSPNPPVEISFNLRIGRLDPILDLAPAPDDKFVPGVQQRLNNLGYNAGPVTGVMNDATRAALRRFQARCNVTGEVDSSGKPIPGPQTLEWLEKIHDRAGKPPPPDALGGSTTPPPVTTSGPTGTTASPTVTTKTASGLRISPELQKANDEYKLAREQYSAAKKKYEDQFAYYKTHRTATARDRLGNYKKEMDDAASTMENKRKALEKLINRSK